MELVSYKRVRKRMPEYGTCTGNLEIHRKLAWETSSETSEQ
jgi:hypothetical protein